MADHRVTFQPGGHDVRVAEGTDLLTAAIAAEIQLYNSCGGEGVCGECRVKVTEGKVNSQHTSRLSPREREAGYRLACCTTVHGDTVVEVPPESRIEWERILTEGTRSERLGGVFTSVQEVDHGRELEKRSGDAPTPLVRKLYLELPAPSLDDSLSDLERLLRGLGRADCGTQPHVPLSVVRRLGRVLRKSNWCVTATLAGTDGRSELILLEPGDTSKSLYGVVVDVGTTTVVASLVDLATGRILDTKAAQNRQGRYGQDVITRIIYSEKDQGLSELHKAVTDTINGLIASMVAEQKTSLNDVLLVNCAGNTTMAHLLLGIDPYYIRRDPFVPTASRIPLSRASETGIRVNPRGMLVCMPNVASYVGGDITAGVLASGLHLADAPTMLIDLGTNGEIALGNREWLVCSSASAGPAFEGSGVSCGTRAVQGAIEGISIDPGSGEVKLRTVQDAKPIGICGSGYIELLGEMFQAGLLDRQGVIDPNGASDRIRKGEEGPEFILAPAEESGTGGDIVITQPDIQNLIRSKGSIYSAAKVLADYMGLGMAEIDRIYIGGGFGNYLNIPKAILIGLLPDLPPERYTFVGNSSLSGARMALLSSRAMAEAEEIAQRMTNIELCAEQAYMGEYVSSLFLPHTDINLFPTVKQLLGV
jgi:uncharacterized 2Fe-2S/4Fe-4S cluster protein (DUF4445 family)